MTRNLQKNSQVLQIYNSYSFIKTFIRQIIINLFDTMCAFRYTILMYDSLWEVHSIYSGYILHHSRDIIHNIIKKTSLFLISWCL